jgi:replicative DNA helicase
MSGQTPYSLRIEHALLGICLLEADAFKKASRLSRSDFSEENAIVFEVGLGLAIKDKPSDAISVALELRRLGKLEAVGGEEYILGLIADRAAEDPRRADDLITKIAEWSARRHASKAAENHVVALMDSAVPFNRALDDVRSAITRASESLGADEFEPLGAMSEALIEGWRFPDRNPGLPTGFAQLDEQINSGLRPGQLVVIAGDTGSGKSSLASQIALTAAHVANVNPGKFGAPEGKVAPVLIFSYEMSKEEIYERMVAQRSPVTDKYRAPRGWLPTDLPLAEEGVHLIANLPLFVFDEIGATVEDVRSAVERFSVTYGARPALVVVDYIGLMNMPGTTNRVEVISHITRSLKAMAREMRLPIIALAQINREAGKRVSHRPGLTDLRESGSIEQDANIVLLVYRESYYIVDPEMKKAAEDGNPDVEVIVAKNRSGGNGACQAP